MTGSVSLARRSAGLVLIAAGAVLLVLSACPYEQAILDYFDLSEVWPGRCAGEIGEKAFLVGGVVVAVLGQRLASGRNLRTGAKPESEQA
jgi:hypothetical protein